MKSLDKKKFYKHPKFMYTLDGQNWYIDGRPVTLAEFIARDGFRKADKKKTKELDWEKILKSTLILTGDEPIEVIFSGGVSKTIRVIPWSMFATTMNKFYTQQRTELLEEIKDSIDFLKWRLYVDNFYKQKTGGVVLSYPLWVEEQITNLLNKKDER